MLLIIKNLAKDTALLFERLKKNSSLWIDQHTNLVKQIKEKINQSSTWQQKIFQEDRYWFLWAWQANSWFCCYNWYLILTMWIHYGLHILGRFLYNTMIGYTIAVSVSTSCSKHYFLLFSSWFLDIYSYRYIPIFLCFTNWSNTLLFNSSLCLSCNLSQAKYCNICPINMLLI